VTAIAATFTDITGALFSASPLPTLILEGDSRRIVAANPAAEERYGYSAQQLVTLYLSDLTDPEDRPRSIASRPMPDGEPLLIELQRHRRKDGTIFPVHCAMRGFRSGDQSMTMVVVTELSELRPHLDEERFAEKMEALARLGGGIALEFNNLLTAILATTDLALGSGNSSPSITADLHSIRAAGQRATLMTRQLLAFSGTQTISLRDTDINKLVESLGPLLEHVMPSNVMLRVDLQATGLTSLDPSRLEQIVLNLVFNAVEAMPEGGLLTVSTENVHDFIAVAIADSGPGMDEITLARLFEPFHTTKGTTGGRGLGLASVYGSVRQMNGSTDVESRSGRGTRVRMFFPRVATASAADSKRISAPVTAPEETRAHAGGEVVLVVEDEPNVRAPICRMLRNHGYYVLEANNGREALQVMSDHHAPVHLVVTDIMMPEMDGAELVALLRDWYPRMGVLFISGVSPEVLDAERATTVRDASFLAKPFELSELVRRAREVLDAEWKQA
jgi:two-component system cell cycle sensor histidine kinase/response regulator CckA